MIDEVYWRFDRHCRCFSLLNFFKKRGHVLGKTCPRLRLNLPTFNFGILQCLKTRIWGHWGQTLYMFLFFSVFVFL